jgi:hypothetical protein
VDNPVDAAGVPFYVRMGSRLKFETKDIERILDHLRLLEATRLGPSIKAKARLAGLLSQVGGYDHLVAVREAAERRKEAAKAPQRRVRLSADKAASGLIWLKTLSFPIADCGITASLSTKGEEMSAEETNEERKARLERENKTRTKQLEQIPLQLIDQSKWPDGVRPIAIAETSGLGIDASGHLHWNGKPVEIVGRRLDLTWGQFWIALVVAIFTVVGGIGAAAQGWAAYHDWACRNKQPALLTCPSVEKPAA